MLILPKFSDGPTDVVIDGLRVGSVPKVIMRSLRDHGCFNDGIEPTLTQLYNKVRDHIKEDLHRKLGIFIFPIV